MIAHILARAVGSRLLLLPLLLGCGKPLPDPPRYSGLLLPDCQPGQLLSVESDKIIVCRTPLTSKLQPPPCPAGTHVLNALHGDVICMEKGTGTTTSEVAKSLSSAETKVAQLDGFIRHFTTGIARYCGQTPNPFSGRFVSASRVGIDAMNSSCSQIPNCGYSGHLCSVYEMYESVAAGEITTAMNIGKSWVYMASWSQEFSDNSGTQDEPGAGLADNCGGFTSADSSKKWYGTAVQWVTADSGQKALKFFSGPGTVGVPGTTTQVANPGAVSCNSMLPAACCQ